MNRRLNAFVVRAAGTELATVRIDLDAWCISTGVPQTIATDDPKDSGPGAGTRLLSSAIRKRDFA